MRLLGIVLCGATLLGTACKSDPPTAAAAPGSLRVTLEGPAGSQHYEVAGAFTSFRPGNSTYAAAMTGFATDEPYSLVAFRARGAGQDALFLQLPALTEPGTYVVTGFLSLGAAEFATPYTLTNIAVTITAISRSRLAGEFQGLGVPVLPFDMQPDTLHLSGGTFDVPVVRSGRAFVRALLE